MIRHIKKNPSVQHEKPQLGRVGKFVANFLLILFCTVVLVLSLRGIAGNPAPTELNTVAWKDQGPLELSPDRGRYALLYAMVENQSTLLTPSLASFAAPDVGYTDGRYVSLFAPGVSVIAIPGYLLGKQFGLAQVGTFAVIAFFGMLNVLLIRAIAIRLGAHPTAASLGGIAFLFASPAFAYAVSLYQHHVSTFLILMSIYIMMRSRSIVALLAVWIICAISVTVDYPNFFMMLPIGLFALGRTFLVQKKEEAVEFSIPILRVLTIASVIIPLSFFLWFNQVSYGSPFTLSGSVERAIQVKKDGTPVLESEIVKARLKDFPQEKQPLVQKSSLLAFFNPRSMINGFNTFFVSPDRGMIFYTPIMLFGIAGIIFLLRKSKYISLFVAIIGINVLLYSMWEDPYGGWAFGSRYLIPTYALLSVFIGVALTKLSKYNLLLLLFFTVFSYSVSVNTLGAITSSRNPPKVEAQALEQVSYKKEEYTYMRNFDLLNKDISKSFIYQTYGRTHISAWSYYTAVMVFIIIVAALLLVYLKADRLKGELYEI